MPTFFQGKTIIAPQVVTAVDDSALNAANVVSSATIGIVGTATGTQPNTAQTFTNAADAVTALRSGAMLDCVRRLFDPGRGTPGASKVVTVRVTNGGSPAARSTLNIPDNAAATTVILTSVDYGVWNNQIRAKVESGTNVGSQPGSLKLTIAAPVSGVVQNVILDNIYRTPFTLQYTGAAAASTATVSTTAVTTSNTGSVDNVNFLFATYPTIQTLVDAFNATGKYTAAVIGLATEPTTDLDSLTAQDIKSAAFTFKAILQAFVDTVNNSGQQFVTAVANRPTSILPPNNPGTFSYMASGTDGGSIVTADWTTALAVLETQDVGIICASTGTAAIHSAVLTHVANMSDINGKRERIAILGGVTGETNAQAITRATNLGNQRVGLVYPGIKDPDPITGVLTAYDPFVTASSVAGVLAGDAVNNAATFKFIGPTAMESILKDSDVDTLLTGGVIPVQNVLGKGMRIVQTLSTSTSDSNFLHTELSVRRTADTISKTVRDNISGLVGATTGPGLLGLAAATVNATLAQLAQNGLLVGVPASANPPYKNVQVSISGNKLTIQYQAQVGVPANYVLITSHLNAFTS